MLQLLKEQWMLRSFVKQETRRNDSRRQRSGIGSLFASLLAADARKRDDVQTDTRGVMLTIRRDGGSRPPTSTRR
jgi:hypothetical protein